MALNHVGGWDFILTKLSWFTHLIYLPIIEFVISQDIVSLFIRVINKESC